jgi:N-acetylglucosaminyldiphosphoundecaprenol N-acetyl-beta-D-mannosaminyltransferase
MESNTTTSEKTEPGVLLGVPIGKRSLTEAVSEAMSAIDNNGPQITVAFVNSNSIAVAQDDIEHFNALNNTSHVIADGVGVTTMARFAGIDVGPRIAGEQYFLTLMNALEQKGSGRLFFFGSNSEVLANITARCRTDFPSLEVCGTISPPFTKWSEEENDLMVDAINKAKPDVLWVGMTAPKQEKWVYGNREKLTVMVIGSIGAVFDYFAGTISSPPGWLRKIGLETIYRLVLAPGRVWKRAILGNSRFVYFVLKRHIL